MPRYDMVCPFCGHEVDVICSYEDAKDMFCDRCQMSEMVIGVSKALLRGLPTPIHHGKVPMHEDKGFKEELATIYKDDPLGPPGGTDG